jgi:microcystin-dependent protein
MALTLTNMGLIEWDQPTDHFSYTDLAANWNKIDVHDHSTGNGVQIPTGGLADLAVTLAKIADSAVGASKIANNAVGTSKVADGAITTAKLPDASITSVKIADANVTLAKLAAAVAQALVPTGTILAWGGLSTAVPTGFLICQGGEFARATYPALDAIIGTTYGPYTNGSGAAGTTHLRVPDFRGRAGIGAGTGAGNGASGTNTPPAGATSLTARTNGSWGGEETHRLLAAESGVNGNGSTTSSGHHQHQYQGEQFNPGGGTQGPHFVPNAGLDSTFALTLPENYWNSDHVHPLVARTADSPHNIMQPWLSVHYLIKT